MVKFSIITVTYNAEKVLPRTANSVLLQKYPAIEHIIVDGVSTDGTISVVKDYMRRSSLACNGHEVFLVSEPDKGLYDAMNKGLARAAGDYVVFLNAGDSLPSADTLQTVAGCVDGAGEQPAVLYGDTDIVDSEYRFLHRRRLTPPERLSWRSFMYGMLVCHQAFYARTDIARATPYDLRYRYSADVDWCIRIMKEAEKRGLALRNVHASVVNYLQEGLTTKHHTASLEERFAIMRCHYGLVRTFAMHVWFVIRAVMKNRP